MISLSTLTWAQLAQVLERLGFSEERVAGSHRLSRRSQDDAAIVLPDEPSSAAVPFVHLAAVKRRLAQGGAADPDIDAIFANGNAVSRPR